MQSIFKSSLIRATVLGLGASMVVGCATSTTPTIDTGPDAEPTFDGLYPVEGGRMDLAWARPDFSIEPYTKVMLKGIGVEYRPGGSRRSSMTSKPGEHFELTPADKERFEQEMATAFTEELATGEHFEIVTEPGPDVLLISGALLDVVSFVPPEVGGRSDVYLSRLGEVTLVIEMRDSMTNAILLRAIDRRAAEDMAGTLTRSNSASNAGEVRRLARAWAVIVREALDRYMAEGDEAGE